MSFAKHASLKLSKVRHGNQQGMHISAAGRTRKMIAVAALIVLGVAAATFLYTSSAPAVAASANVSLAGVHWYSGDSAMLDSSIPPGERGWNVEVIFDTGWCDGDPASDPGGVRSVAQVAKAHGLVNIIRVDYRQMLAVPANSGEFPAWATDFIKCTSELSDLSSIYIVGNEPNIEGGLSAGQYAAAFNYLLSRRGEMPAGTELLATFNSPFTPVQWMNAMSAALNNVDGFAIHTGGIRSNCQDPRQPCSFGGWPFDGAFLYYRDIIDQIDSRWWGRPVYITEFNTYTGDPGAEPQNNYINDWINKAFAEVRSYNASRGSKPQVRTLAWFVDRPQSWPLFALRNIGTARTDMGEEFRNPANRPGAPSATSTPNSTSPPPTSTAPNPTAPSGQNVALGAAWQASSTYGAAWGGDKATDGVVTGSSKWTSNGSSPESWLALDLGQAYNISQFVVRHAGAAGEETYFNTKAFRLESGPSFGGPWTTLATVNNASQGQNVSSVQVNITSRFVRLFITDAGVDNYARIPEFEVYGQASGNPTSTPQPTNPPPTSTPGPAGPLQNGGFEGGVQANGVGNNWGSFASAGYGGLFAVVSDEQHSGARSQLAYAQPSSNNQFAGVYQTIATTPGASYTVRAWNKVSLPNGSGWPLIGRLGIDLSGATNYSAGSVSWIEFDAPENGVGNWTIRERTITASGSSMTIFLQSWRKWNTGGASYTWFDDIEVIPIGGGPTPTSPAPTSTSPAPTPTVPPGQNVALGANWQASSVYGPAWGGDKATDGVVTTASKWTSDGSTALSWLTLDLGQTFNVTGFVVRHAGAAGDASKYNIKAFRVESGPSLSGPWTTLATVNNASQNQNVSVGLLSTTARFVRLTVTDAGIDNYARISEFEIYAQGVVAPTPTPTLPPGQNIALGAAWQASSVYGPEWGGDKATDGIVTNASKWTSDGSTAVSWLALDLGQTFNVTGFVVRHAGAAGGASQFNIQAFRVESGPSISGPWTTLGSITNPHQTQNVSIVPASTTARFVRLTVTDAGIDNYARISEFEVYAQGSVGPTPTPSPTSPAPTPTPGPAGPLQNGGFEGMVQSNGVGDSWTAFSSPGYGASFAVNPYSGMPFDIQAQLVHAQPSTNDQYAGVYQTIATTPGTSYLVRAWNRVSLKNGSGWPLIGRLGIDLNGGSNYTAGSVSWIEFDAPENGNGIWVMRERTITASGNSMTVYLQSWRKWATGGESNTWFDNVEVLPQGGTPPTATPAPTGTAPSPTSTAPVPTSTAPLPTPTAPGPTPPMPDFCPPALNFAAIRQDLNQQGQDLAFVKIGFHAGVGGNHTGIGEWEQCLDAAGVPFFLKSVDDAGKILEAVQLKAASGVPHTLVYRKVGAEYDVPDYTLPPLTAATEHWQRHMDVFPPELLPYKDLIWLETLNEIDKGQSEWLGEFAYHTAQLALAQGFNWAAFGFSSGEPEPEHWEGQWMRQFLQLAAANPDRIAVALHEYSFDTDSLKHGLFDYPSLVGRYEKLYEITDSFGLARPTVLITEFGWQAYSVPPVDVAFDRSGGSELENLVWAAEMYAQYPSMKGAAIWYLGQGYGNIADQTQPLIRPLLEFALQNYYAIPQQSSNWAVSKTDFGPADASHSEGDPANLMDGDPNTAYAVVQDAAAGSEGPSIEVNIRQSDDLRPVSEIRVTIHMGAPLTISMLSDAYLSISAGPQPAPLLAHWIWNASTCNGCVLENGQVLTWTTDEPVLMDDIRIFFNAQEDLGALLNNPIGFLEMEVMEGQVRGPTIFEDQFSRIDGTDIGSAWQEVRGEWSLLDGQLFTHGGQQNSLQDACTSLSCTETTSSANDNTSLASTETTTTLQSQGSLVLTTASHTTQQFTIETSFRVVSPFTSSRSFADVPIDHDFYNEIETLYRAGYTAGCQVDPLLFCPEATMNRAESAVFVERGIHGAGVIPSAPTSQVFADLPLDSWAAKWATALYEDGFTAGCGEAPLVYCPWQGHTRTEGTVFYLRMLNGADYLPPEPTGVFADVALDFWGADWIEAAYAAGLIPACGENPLRFCPDAPLTRSVAANMMVQAIGPYPLIQAQAELVFGAAVDGSGGYKVVYHAQFGKLDLLAPSGSTLASTFVAGGVGSLRALRVERLSNGTINVYLDTGSGFTSSPQLSATDTSSPELGRLGFGFVSAGHDLYVLGVRVEALN